MQVKLKCGIPYMRFNILKLRLLASSKIGLKDIREQFLKAKKAACE